MSNPVYSSVTVIFKTPTSIAGVSYNTNIKYLYPQILPDPDSLRKQLKIWKRVE